MRLPWAAVFRGPLSSRTEDAEHTRHRAGVSHGHGLPLMLGAPRIAVNNGFLLLVVANDESHVTTETLGQSLLRVDTQQDGPYNGNA